MKELLNQRREAVEAALAQAKREIDAMTGALMELQYLISQLPPEPTEPTTDEKAPG